MMKLRVLGILCMSHALLHAGEKTTKLPWPQPTEVMRLWSGDAPGLVSPRKEEEIVNERIRNVSVPELWAYLPPKSEKKRTAILICPGGGYAHHAMGLHVGNVVKLFHEQEMVVFGLKYRTRYGANDVAADAVADCERALRIIRRNAAAWGIDRIGVQGYSAGGNILLNLLGCHDAGDAKSADPTERFSSRPDFLALMCPWPHGKAIGQYSILPNPPPVFIASAEDDTVAPLSFAKEIADAVKKQNGSVRTFYVPTGGHAAFHIGVSKGPGAEWPNSFFEMLKDR